MEKKRNLSASDYVQLINIETGKVLAFLLVILSTIYHLSLHQDLFRGQEELQPHPGQFCKGLWTKGMFKSADFWQPQGCMIHEYTHRETDRCFSLRNLDIAFVGDSRMRQLYRAVTEFLESGSVSKIEKEGELNKTHADLKWTDSKKKYRVAFYWTPLFNETRRLFDDWVKKDGPKVPTHIFMGFSTHYIKITNNSVEGKELYERDINSLRSYLSRLTFNRKSTQVFWVLQPPVNNRKLNEFRKMIANPVIDSYNWLAESILSDDRDSKIQIWNSLHQLTSSSFAMKDSVDGLHLPYQVLTESNKILFNYFCNDFVSVKDGNCCKSPHNFSDLQYLVLISILTGLLFASIAFGYRCLVRTDDPIASSATWTEAIVMALSKQTTKTSTNVIEMAPKPQRDTKLFLVKMSLIAIYFLVCDRTDFFMKENKYFIPFNFFMPVLYCLVLGIFFSEETKDPKFLNRDQSDEWKGWMQLVILIYHMTGASRSVPIYMNMRLLVSSYIFLNAYGHFCYAWYKGDFSFQRYLQVLFRMNCLTVMLCLIMDMRYQSYYFVPLISFWFTLQYVVMALPPQLTAKETEKNPLLYLYLILKLIFLTSLVSILYMSEIFFERIFLSFPWKPLFESEQGDIGEWWFRWRLDRYSMVGGFAFGALVVVLKKFKHLEDSKSSAESRYGILFPNKVIRCLALFVSLMGIAGFLVFAIFCRLKEECNEIHPYICVIPILSFLILRNFCGFARTRYSSFFAWFGKISLELFICQYHIWLAKDTQGVLVLVPGYPMANLVLTTFVFVCVSHEVHKISNFFTERFSEAVTFCVKDNDSETLNNNNNNNTGNCKKNNKNIFLSSWLKNLFLILLFFAPLCIYQQFSSSTNIS